MFLQLSGQAPTLWHKLAENLSRTFLRPGRQGDLTLDDDDGDDHDNGYVKEMMMMIILRDTKEICLLLLLTIVTRIKITPELIIIDNR